MCIRDRHGVGLNIIQPVLLDGKPVSSTRIRQAILDGRMDDASRMLGRRFCLSLIHILFKITGVGTVAGCYVLEGKITRNAEIRIVRDGIIIADEHLTRCV